MHWKILTEKKKYETFNCNIAKLDNYFGRNWTALYDPNVSLSKGPYEFNGLPGLIMKVSDDKNHYTFSLQKIEKVPYYDIEVTEKYTKLDSREKFLKLKRNFTENPFSNLPSGIKINMDPVQMKSAIERYKKNNNNPIELD